MQGHLGCRPVGPKASENDTSESSNREVADHAERHDVLLALGIHDRAERVEDGLLRSP